MNVASVVEVVVLGKTLLLAFCHSEHRHRLVKTLTDLNKNPEQKTQALRTPWRHFFSRAGFFPSAQGMMGEKGKTAGGKQH